MWKSSTIKGLDAALADLQRSIDGLPDGNLKRQLTQRFKQLKTVRDDLDCKPSPQIDSFNLLLIMFAMVVFTFLLFLILSRK